MIKVSENEKDVVITIKKSLIIRGLKAFIEDTYGSKVTKINKNEYFKHICNVIQSNPEEYIGEILDKIDDDIYTNAETFVTIKECD